MGAAAPRDRQRRRQRDQARPTAAGSCLHWPVAERQRHVRPRHHRAQLRPAGRPRRPRAPADDRDPPAGRRSGWRDANAGRCRFRPAPGGARGPRRRADRAGGAAPADPRRAHRHPAPAPVRRTRPGRPDLRAGAALRRAVPADRYAVRRRLQPLAEGRRDRLRSLFRRRQPAAPPGAAVLRRAGADGHRAGPRRAAHHPAAGRPDGEARRRRHADDRRQVRGRPGLRRDDRPRRHPRREAPAPEQSRPRERVVQRLGAGAGMGRAAGHHGTARPADGAAARARLRPGGCPGLPDQPAEPRLLAVSRAPGW